VTSPRRSDGKRRNLVPTVAESLRERVFGGVPDERIGSLTELATELNVGIVTIQQAARILEHEGLLDVRRGPGGGYYGRRPDAQSLERVLAAFMRMHPDSFDEALDITSLLFIELCGAAARCASEDLRTGLQQLLSDLTACRNEKSIGAFESNFQNLLFRMVDRPIFELLTRVTLHFATVSGRPQLYRGSEGLRRWLDGRRRIITAIMSGDEKLARFEADRSNRPTILAVLGSSNG
jgi:GntR family transcriptional repressor for pyruvate dehydrogenase complex